MDVHFSSEKQDWATPKSLFYRLDNYYKFGLDAAASIENALCDDFFTEEDNSLVQDWSGYGNVFLNPPYGREGPKFIAKAYQEFENGVTTVMLIPARTDTKAWHSYILYKDNIDVRFLKGRLKFGDAKNSAPFPSALVVFNGKKEIFGLDL